MIRSKFNSEFDAEKYLENMHKQYEERKKARSVIPPGAIAGDPWDAPPGPNMRHDAGLWMWVPDIPEKEDDLVWNPDEVPDVKHPGYSITGKKLPYTAELTNQPGNQLDKQLVNQSDNLSPLQSPVSDSKQATLVSTTEGTALPATSQEEKPPVKKKEPTPKETRKESVMTKVKAESTPKVTPPEEPAESTETSTEVIIAADTTIMTAADIAESRTKVVVSSTVTGKVTRISAKMRRASRQEFHDAYLVKTDTKGGKPITISADLIKRLYRICARSGDYRACPTYLVNNLLVEILDIIEPDTEGWADLD